MDITMCKDDNCKFRKRCLRFTAKPDIYQSYFMGSPREEDSTKEGKEYCEYFWK